MKGKVTQTLPRGLALQDLVGCLHLHKVAVTKSSVRLAHGSSLKIAFELDLG